MDRIKKIVMLLSLTLVAATGQAETLTFSCISGNNSGNCAIGQQQLSVEVSDPGNNQALFTIYNLGPDASSVEGVYFDDGTLLGISYLIDMDEGIGGDPGVDFTAGSAAPPNLPGGNSINPAFVTTAGFLADSDPPTQHNGINPGESLGIAFDLQTGSNFDFLINDLRTAQLRIGLHVIGFGSGGSESFVNNTLTTVAIPTPLALFCSGLAVLLFHRKAVLTPATSANPEGAT